MPKDLPDLEQRRAGGAHLRGRGMPQAMRTDNRQPRAGAGPGHNLADTAGRQRTPRCQRAQEQAARTTASSAIAAIVGDRLADINRQRQRLAPIALARHEQLPGAPVDVVYRQTGHFRAPQTQPRQDFEDGVIPESDTGSAITGLEYPGDLVGGHRPHDALVAPARRNRHRVDQQYRY